MTYHKHAHGRRLLAGAEKHNLHVILQACDGNRDAALAMIAKFYPEKTWPIAHAHHATPVIGYDGKWYWTDITIGTHDEDSYNIEYWQSLCRDCNHREGTTTEDGGAHDPDDNLRWIGPYLQCSECCRWQRPEWVPAYEPQFIYGGDADWRSEDVQETACWWMIHNWPDQGQAIPFMNACRPSRYGTENQDLWVVPTEGYKPGVRQRNQALLQGVALATQGITEVDWYVDRWGYPYIETDGCVINCAICLPDSDHPAVEVLMLTRATAWADLLGAEDMGGPDEYPIDITLHLGDAANALYDMIAELGIDTDALRLMITQWAVVVETIKKVVPIVDWPNQGTWAVADTMLRTLRDQIAHEWEVEQ